MKNIEVLDDFDGFYLIPSDDRENIEYRFFKFQDQDKLGEKIDGSRVGDMYHVALFSEKEGQIEVDGCFEAIFADPIEYSRNLYGLNMFGTFLKKRQNSTKWWENYLTSVFDRVIMKNIELKQISK